MSQTSPVCARADELQGHYQQDSHDRGPGHCPHRPAVGALLRGKPPVPVHHVRCLTFAACSAHRVAAAHQQSSILTTTLAGCLTPHQPTCAALIRANICSRALSCASQKPVQRLHQLQPLIPGSSLKVSGGPYLVSADLPGTHADRGSVSAAPCRF